MSRAEQVCLQLDLCGALTAEEAQRLSAKLRSAWEKFLHAGSPAKIRHEMDGLLVDAAAARQHASAIGRTEMAARWN